MTYTDGSVLPAYLHAEDAAERLGCSVSSLAVLIEEGTVIAGAKAEADWIGTSVTIQDHAEEEGRLVANRQDRYTPDCGQFWFLLPDDAYRALTCGAVSPKVATLRYHKRWRHRSPYLHFDESVSIDASQVRVATFSVIAAMRAAKPARPNPPPSPVDSNPAKPAPALLPVEKKESTGKGRVTEPGHEEWTAEAARLVDEWRKEGKRFNQTSLVVEVIKNLGLNRVESTVRAVLHKAGF